MLENLKKYNVVLASNSPRRKELLKRLGIPFKVRTLFGIDESYPDTLRGEDIVRYISRNKAKAYRSSMAPNELLITADTIVYLGGQVMGKPRSAEDANFPTTADLYRDTCSLHFCSSTREDMTRLARHSSVSSR